MNKTIQSVLTDIDARSSIDIETIPSQEISAGAPWWPVEC